MSTIHNRSDAELELAADVLRLFGELRFVAYGSSMLPEIYPGDHLFVSRVTPASVRAGQVVLVSRGGRFYAHRVVSAPACTGAVTLVTRGDALPDLDPPASEHDLLGRVTAVVRGRKRIELSEKLGFWRDLLSWALRNSDALAALLLRWHLLRTRFARKPCLGATTASAKLVECQ